MMIFNDRDIEYEIRLSPNQGEPPDFVHVIIAVSKASSKERAQQAAVELASLFTSGREVWWRVEPEADEATDFATMEKIRHGYARFSFRLVPGEHHFPEKERYERYLPKERITSNLLEIKLGDVNEARKRRGRPTSSDPVEIDPETINLAEEIAFRRWEEAEE